jgi:hypothetical protein
LSQLEFDTPSRPRSCARAARRLPGDSRPPNPLLWGTEDHVRALFEGTEIELELARETLAPPEFDSLEEEIEYTTSKFGPLVLARRMLEPQGRWESLLYDYRRLAAERNAAEYLVIVGRKH